MKGWSNAEAAPGVSTTQASAVAIVVEKCLRLGMKMPPLVGALSVGDSKHGQTFPTFGKDFRPPRLSLWETQAACGFPRLYSAPTSVRQGNTHSAPGRRVLGSHSIYRRLPPVKATGNAEV